MNIIIVGAGKVGTALAETLSREGHSVTVIESDKAVLERCVATLDVQGVLGSGTSYRTQTDAGVAEADLLIAVTGRDEVSLLSCLMARKAGHPRTIARVRDPDYYDEISYIKEELGLSMAVNPDRSAAAEIMRLIQIPSAMEVDTFARGRLQLVGLRVEPGTLPDGISVAELAARVKQSFLICTRERGDEVIIPDGDTVLRAGDGITVCVSLPETAELLGKITRHTKRIKRVMLAGGSGVAFYLAKMLIRARVAVKIIERDRERCEQLSKGLPEAVVVCGDATDQQLLLEEGIRETDAFVALTNIDEENILLSIFASSVSSAKRITKISWLALEKIIDKLPVGSVVYPKNITAERIIRYVRALQNVGGSNVETLYRLGDGRVEALEFAVKRNADADRLIGVPLSRMRLRPGILVCGINRGGKVITPTGRDCFEEGDTAVVVTTHTGLKDLRDILRDA